MDILNLMESRHSVRQYLDKEIETEKREIIDNLINEINKAENLKIKSFYDEPNAFNSILAHYGKFECVKNYIALIGTKNQAEILGFMVKK